MGKRIRVFRYGLLAPTENAELVREQMRLAHKYRNKLTEIERKRRAAHRDLLTSRPRIFELECELDKAVECVALAKAAITAHREKSQTRTTPKELTCALTEAKAKRIALSKDLAALRKAERDSHMVEFDALNMASAEQHRAARAECGVYWGTYMLIEDAAQASKKMPLYDGKEPNDPRFVRWTGEGRIGVHVAHGMPSEAIFSPNTLVHVRPVNEAAWYSPVRGERRAKARTTLVFRVGSDKPEGKAPSPIWAEFPMVMHRPLPANSLIKNVAVQLVRHGPREEWTALFTVDETQSERPRPPKNRHPGAVAIDLGWRLIGDEIRVAFWRGEDGRSGELRLPAQVIGAFRKSDDLQAIRKRNFNLALADLVAWRKTHDLPPELHKKTERLATWDSQARLASVALFWRKNRFDGDEEPYSKLEAWRYHDHHLWEWESNQRVKAARHRRELYRIFAARLADEYATIVIEQFDLRRVARKQSQEDESHENQTARRNRVLANPSSLRTILELAFARCGESWRAPAIGTTRKCSVCGLAKAFDAAEKIENTCPNGHTWDQDDNAASNLLALWREHRGDAEHAGDARKSETLSKVAELPESRWTRANRLASEKLKRAAAARKAALKSA